MGYTTFLMGSLYVDGKVQRISQSPVPTVSELDQMRRHGSTAPSDGLLVYQGGSISIGNTQPGHAIQWIKPNGINLLVADRVLLSDIAWEDLNREDFANGKVVYIEGRRYLCRLLRVGLSENASNEWDECLDEVGEDDELWHWNHIPFWGRERFLGDGTEHATRGMSSARAWQKWRANFDMGGFRPALIPLAAESPVDKAMFVTLEGEEFEVLRYGGVSDSTFTPVLSPTMPQTFISTPRDAKLHMYTLLADGKPVRQDLGIPVYPKGAKLEFTDRHFGNEFLITWNVSGSMAFATAPVLGRIAEEELLEQGFNVTI